MRLMTVVTGLFKRRDATGGSSGAALSAAVHRWMEGRVAATRRRVSGDTDEPMPSRPFRSRDGDELGGMVAEAMRRFQVGAQPAAAGGAAGLGWGAGRRAGLECPGGALANAEMPLPRAIRARLAEVRYHVRWSRRPRRLLTARGAIRPLLGDRGKRGTLAEGAKVAYVSGEIPAGPGATDARVI
jgi:hypothetical protein